MVVVVLMEGISVVMTLGVISRRVVVCGELRRKGRLMSYEHWEVSSR